MTDALVTLHGKRLGLSTGVPGTAQLLLDGTVIAGPTPPTLVANTPPVPLAAALGGTGIIGLPNPNSSSNPIVYINDNGELQTDNNLRYDCSKQEISITGGVNSQLRQRLAASFAKTNNTLANVSQSGSTLSLNLTSAAANPGNSYSGVYDFEAILRCDSNVAAGVKAAISGTCTVSSIEYDVLIVDAGAWTQGRQTALGGATGVTAVTNPTIIITGNVVVSVAGTLTVQFAQNATNAAASTVHAGARFVAYPVS